MIVLQCRPLVEDEELEVVFDFLHIFVTELREHLANTRAFILKAKVANKLILLVFEILLKLVKGRSFKVLFSFVDNLGLYVLNAGLANLGLLLLIKLVRFSC